MSRTSNHSPLTPTPQDAPQDARDQRRAASDNRATGRAKTSQGGQAQTTPARADGERANKWVVLAIVAIGVFMSTLDSSIVNISLPTIARYFAVSLNGAVEWVIIAYLVVIASVLLTIGRLSDIIGRKPIWAAGLVIFTLGSALCGAAPSLGLLVAFRAAQGLGGALLFAVSPAMLTAAFPTEERGRALGLNAVIVALGVSAGPTIGGILTESLTWRSIFYVNVPLGVIGLIFTLRALTEPLKRGRGRFDPVGATLLGLGLALLTLGLSFGQEWGWSSPGLIATLLGGALFLGAFVYAERRVADPIVKLDLLRNRVFASANISLVISFLALFAVSFMLPFYFEQLRHFSTLKAGLLLTPLPLAIACVAPISGALADRMGTRWLAAIGLGIACVGVLFVSQLDATSSLFDIIWRLALTGVGQGLFQSPNNSALIGSAPPQERGTASGFLATGRVVGQSLSVALAGAIFASLGGTQAGAALAHAASGGGRAHPLTPERVATLQHSFLAGFHGAFVACGALAAIGVITSLARGNAG